MNKHKYYVSVHGRSVLMNKGATSYEWEIEATSEQAQEIAHLMRQLEEEEQGGFIHHVFPWPDTPEEEMNMAYQHALDDIYKSIYDLCSECTRLQMRESGINAFLQSYDG
ncbi:hypothetical protein [Paenibacillus sp. CMAA1364]